MKSIRVFSRGSGARLACTIHLNRAKQER